MGGGGGGGGGVEPLNSCQFPYRLCSSGCIKISDFGLTEDVYSQNYFRQARDGAKLPMKWMALESIKLGVFSEKSDVVSNFLRVTQQTLSGKSRIL